MNTDKAKVIFQSPSSHTLPVTNIIIDGRPLENMDQFTYLGSRYPHVKKTRITVWWLLFLPLND